MAYLLIEDLRGGVDRRRPIHALKAGALWTCINAHITNGGDVEKRKAFVGQGDFSPTTFGLAAQGDVLYTFGSVAEASVTLPGGVHYQRLESIYGGPMTAVVDWDLFGGKLYVIARFADGFVEHFYDGTLITSWTEGIVRASMGTLATLATKFAALINARAAARYSATAAGNVVTITAVAVDLDFTVQTLAIDGGLVDDQTIVYATTTPAAPATAQVGTITLGGTFDPGDRFGFSLTTGSVSVVDYFGNYAQPFGNAATVKTHKRKMYAGAGGYLHFSAVNDPTLWNTDADPGAGFLIASNHVGGSEEIKSLEGYQGRLAPFARRAIQLWTMQNDDALNVPEQFIEHTGTRSSRSTLEFGGNDVFYLDDSGINSLKARDASNNAFVSGVAAPINKLVRDWMRTVSQDDIERAVSAVEPTEARFWMAIAGRVFVYSFFPSAGIAAWSWYEPGFTISDFARTGNSLWCRAGDTLYLYGGASGEVYDASRVEVQFPFLSAGKPGTFKNLFGTDMAAEGTWNCTWYINPNNALLDEPVVMGEYTGVTFSQPDWVSVGSSTHIAPLFTHELAEYASLSIVALYYQGAEEST